MRGRLGSVRARVTIAATLAVAVVLIVVGVFIIQMTASSAVRDAQNVAEVQARNLAIVVEAGRVSQVLDVDSAGSTVLQVVAENGEVLAASPQLEGVPALISGVPEVGSTYSSTARVVSWLGEEEDYEVVSLGTSSPDGPVAVLAGVSLEGSHQALAGLVRTLSSGMLAVLMVVAGVSWLVTGWALGPVAAIRREVDDITESQLDRRVPVPEHKDEVHRLAVTMNRMLSRLQEATARQQAFIGDASHELRSPVASLRTQLEVAAAHPTTFTTKELADETLADVLRLETLAEELLKMAKLDAGSIEESASKPLGQVLSELLDGRHGDRIPVDLKLGEGVEAPVPVGVTTQAVTNLLDNAERHAGVQVVLQARAAGGSVRVIVLDDGPGIPTEHRERIFERFVRLDDARSREDGGTGLGLPIARELARSKGGDLKVVESASGGAFELTLPTST